MPGLATIDIATGIWTPALAFGGVAPGLTYAAQNGSFTRIGRETTCRFNLALAGKGSGAGVATLSGIPGGVSPDLSNNGAGGLVAQYANMAGVSSNPVIGLLPSATSVFLLEFNAVGSAFLTDANFTNTTSIAGAFSFIESDDIPAELIQQQIVFSQTGPMQGGLIIGRWLCAVPTTFPANLAGSVALADAAATLSTTFVIAKNGVQNASQGWTLTYGAGATTGTFNGPATNFTTGDLMTLIVPTPPDATLAGVIVAIAAVPVT